MRKKIFGDREFMNRLISLTLPIAFQSLMLSMVAAADAVMLGRLEQNSMAAVSLATQIQFVQNILLMSITGAASILGSQYWGKGDEETINRVFCISLRAAGVISICFCILCETVPDFLMRIFTNEEELIAIGIGYLKIAGWSYLLTGISQCYLTIMKVTDHAQQCARISSVAVVINIVLNAVFIFGLAGVTMMGARGAALATLIARIIELAWSILSSHQKGYMRPDLSQLFHRDAELSRDYWKVEWPLMGASLLWGIGFTSYTAVMGHMGADAAAANSIAAVVRDLMCCLCNGISNAGGIVVGNALGSGDLEKGKAYGEHLLIISFLCGVLSALIILAVSPFVLQYMKLTETAHGYLSGMLVIMAVYMIARCMTTIVINGVFGAGGDTLFDMYSLVVSMWCIAIPLSFAGAFAFHWPVLVVYVCTCVDEVGKIPWVIYHFKKYKWVRDLTRESTAA